MADKKISQLDQITAGSIVAAADVLPLVEGSGGDTKKVAVADLVGAGVAAGVSNVTVSDLTASKPVFTDASKKLVSTGTMPVNQGGTGLTASPTNGQLLVGNGTGYTLATLTAGSGITVTNGAGTITVASAGLPELEVVSGTTQAAVKGKHYVLVNAALTTVTLPATPTLGDTVWVTVANGRVDNVVARNGSNIISLASDLVLNATYAAVQLRYADATRGWILI